MGIECMRHRIEELLNVPFGVGKSRSHANPSPALAGRRTPFPHPGT